MSVANLSFYQSDASSTAKNVYVQVLRASDRTPVDIASVGLAYRKPVRYGYILKHAASVLDDEYVSFSLLGDVACVDELSMPGADVSGGGRVAAVSIHGKPFVVGGVVRRDVLTKADEDYDYISLDEVVDADLVSVSYVDRPFIDGRVLNEYMMELEADEIRKHLSSSSRHAYFTYFSGSGKLARPRTAAADADYICFTDTIALDVDGWSVVRCSLPKRYVLTHPHVLLRSRPSSTWVANDVFICSTPSETLDLLGPDDYLLASASVAADDVYSLLDDKYLKIKNFLVADGYPSNAGLACCDELVMKHHDGRLKRALETLYEAMTVMKQEDPSLLLNYSLWMSHGKYSAIPEALMNLRFFAK